MTGQRQPIQPILLVPPAAGSLLQSAGSFPAGDWQSGVAFEQREWFAQAWPDCVPDWETCTEETLTDKPVGSSDVIPDCEQWAFDPFTVYTPISEISVQPDLAQRLGAQIRAMHDVLFSSVVAKVLAGCTDSVYGSMSGPLCIDTGVNPTLPSSDTSLAVTVAPETALALLWAAYAAEMGTTGGAMLHVHPVVLPYLVSKALVAQVGQRYQGPGGLLVVADAGYDCLGATDLSTTAYITGPVEVAYDAAKVVPGSELLDARLNQWAMLVEQRAIYRFDPRSVFSLTVVTPQPDSGEV